MKTSKLLRFLLAPIAPLGIVEEGGGSASAEEGEDAGIVEEGEQEPGAGGLAGEAGGGDNLDEAVPGDNTESNDEEIVVSIGDEPAASEQEDGRPAPDWLKELRNSNRQKDKRIRELEAKVAQAAPPVQEVVVGERPKLSDHDYDEDKYNAALDEWHSRKANVEKQRRDREQAEQQQQAAWKSKVSAYDAAKAELKVRDFEDAEDIVKDKFSTVQQAIILEGLPPKQAATIIYALGKNPKKAAELAGVTNPVQFAFAIAKLETQLKVTPRKVAPPPEGKIKSSVAGATAVDDQLKRLQDEADKTGDRSKVASFLRQRERAKQAA
jgi:hypothetical protein